MTSRGQPRYCRLCSSIQGLRSGAGAVTASALLGQSRLVEAADGGRKVRRVLHHRFDCDCGIEATGLGQSLLRLLQFTHMRISGCRVSIGPGPCRSLWIVFDRRLEMAKAKLRIADLDKKITKFGWRGLKRIAAQRRPSLVRGGQEHLANARVRSLRSPHQDCMKPIALTSLR